VLPEAGLGEDVLATHSLRLGAPLEGARRERLRGLALGARELLGGRIGRGLRALLGHARTPWGRSEAASASRNRAKSASPSAPMLATRKTDFSSPPCPA